MISPLPPDHEAGYEKIAIYIDGRGFRPTPLDDRQLPNGRWTSKLGENADIEHDTLDVLAGRCTGGSAISPPVSS